MSQLFSLEHKSAKMSQLLIYAPCPKMSQLCPKMSQLKDPKSENVTTSKVVQKCHNFCPKMSQHCPKMSQLPKSGPGPKMSQLLSKNVTTSVRKCHNL